MTEDFFDNINFELEKTGKGKVLISEPFLPDPNFSRTVILLTEHNTEGSIGFILNRASTYQIEELIEDFPEFNAKVYVGGPVGLNQLFFIHTLGDKIEDSQEIVKGLYWGGNFEHLKLLIEAKEITPKDIRFFAGYSGWSVDQLQNEINEKSWIVASTNSDQVMMQSDEYWQEFMQSLGKKFKIMSSFPEDPSLN